MSLLVNNNDGYFIRFGEIPADERSRIHRNGELIVGIECGVSVYDAVKIRGEWKAVLPNPCTECTVDTMHGILLSNVNNESTKKAYIVTGDIVGYGSDGEPLIRNIRVVEELDDYYFRYLR